MVLNVQHEEEVESDSDVALNILRLAQAVSTEYQEQAGASTMSAPTSLDFEGENVNPDFRMCMGQGTSQSFTFASAGDSYSKIIYDPERASPGGEEASDRDTNAGSAVGTNLHRPNGEGSSTVTMARATTTIVNPVLTTLQPVPIELVVGSAPAQGVQTVVHQQVVTQVEGVPGLNTQKPVYTVMAARKDLSLQTRVGRKRMYESDSEDEEKEDENENSAPAAPMQSDGVALDFDDSSEDERETVILAKKTCPPPPPPSTQASVTLASKQPQQPPQTPKAVKVPRVRPARLNLLRCRKAGMLLKPRSCAGTSIVVGKGRKKYFWDSVCC